MASSDEESLKFSKSRLKKSLKKSFKKDAIVERRTSVVDDLLEGKSYSDSQKHESSCLLSDRFCCISPELLELQKIRLHLFILVFEELLAGTRIFQIR